MDKNTLLAYQPDYYKTSKVMEHINNANATELNLVNSRIALVKNNYDMDTSDSNTLTRWENEFKLKVLPNDSLEYRRSRIKSRFLGQGDFSKKMIKDIFKSYIDADIDTILDLPNFNFTIKLDSNIGIPVNIEDFMDVIEEVKPSYLQANYKMTSNTTSILSVAAFSAYGEEIRVFPYQITNVNSEGIINIALGYTSGAETVTVGPKEG